MVHWIVGGNLFVTLVCKTTIHNTDNTHVSVIINVCEICLKQCLKQDLGFVRCLCFELNCQLNEANQIIECLVILLGHDESH